MGELRAALGVTALGGLLSMVATTGVVDAAASRVQEIFVTNDATRPVPTARRPDRGDGRVEMVGTRT